MPLAPEELIQAVADGVITAGQAQQLAAWQSGRGGAAATAAAIPSSPRFDLLHLLYYGGAVLVLGAMSWWMNRAINNLSGWGIFALALGYALLFALLGLGLRSRFATPGGLFYFLAVAMTPLALYGLERQWGWAQSPLHGYGRIYQPPPLTFVHSVFLAGVTLAVALLAVVWTRVPLLLAEVAVAFGCLCISVAIWWQHGSPHTRAYECTSVGAGLALLLAGWWVDRRTPEDFGFWLYLFGVVWFWGGLIALPETGEGAKLAFFLINLALINASLLLQRKVFLIFGALGCATYFGHLAYTLFPNSLGFPLTLSGLGVLLIVIGVQFQKRQEGIEASLLELLPAGVRAALPRHRAFSPPLR
ncbi:MAG: hypothetical protein ACRD1E_02045 [Terriglobales bacterium]